MDYTVINSQTNFQKGSDFFLVTKNENLENGISITRMNNGMQDGDEMTYEPETDVMVDPLAIIDPSIPVYVEEGAVSIFNEAIDYSILYNEKNGNVDLIADELETRVLGGANN